MHKLTRLSDLQGRWIIQHHRKQVTHDAKGRVCNLGSGAELWMSGNGTRFVLAAAIMSVGERERERVAGD